MYFEISNTYIYYILYILLYLYILSYILKYNIKELFNFQNNLKEIFK